jgi:hypothetical protein
VNRDPIGKKGGKNNYNFCNNIPTTRNDMLGLLPTPSYNYFPKGKVEVTLGGAFGGVFRSITLKFLMKPGRCCHCSRLGTQQSFVVTNLEGPETHQIWEGPDGVERAWMVGERVSDPPNEPGPWMPVFDGTGYGLPHFVHDCEDEMPGDISLYDAPGSASEPTEFRGDMSDGPSFPTVKRRLRVDVATCFGCKEGEEAGELYGCAKWRLDYDDPSSPSAVVSLRFDGWSTSVPGSE